MLNMLKKEKNIFILSRKKLIIILLLCFSFTLVGYTFPTNQPYLIVSDTFSNNDYIFFARDRVEYINIVDNKIINSYSSTIYAYNTNYRISFPTYSTDYTYTSGYQSQTYTISQIKENHLYDDDSFNLESHKTIVYLSIFGGILLCLLVSLVKS